jgi:steroid 5-alpha reductase family enzyme
MTELSPPLELKALLTPLELAFYFVVGWTFCGFALSRALKRNDVADLLWGSGITFLIVSMGFLTGDAPLNPAQWLIMVLVTLWGSRLTLYLAIRNLPEPEDSRYAAWRLEWGKKEPLIALFRVFLLQSVFAVFVAAAGWGGLIDRTPELPLKGLHVILGFLSLTGLFIEAIADLQLMHFKSHQDPTHRSVLNTGLWRYSRHPNYFGEALFWLAITGLSLSVATNAGWMLLAALGSSFLTFLLLKVSGVTMTERGMRARRKSEDYESYINSTSPFIPLPPNLYQRIKQKRTE